MPSQSLLKSIRVGVQVVCLGCVSTLGWAQTDAVDAATRYLRDNKQQFNLTGSDLNEVAVSSTTANASTGITHVYLQQRYRGIDVWNGIATINVRADGSVLLASSRFYSNIAPAAGGQSARKAAHEAAHAAAQHVSLKPSVPIVVLEKKGDAADTTTLSDGGISAKPIEARLVWVPVQRGVRLAWVVEIEEPGGEHWWLALVDAETGNSLGQEDLVVRDSIMATAAAIAHESAAPAPAPSFPSTDGAAYRVFPLPFENPTDTDRQLVSNAAHPVASLFGWHDTNGVPGAEFTRTRGNNVHAYTDIDANNAADPDSDPDGGTGLLFDFPLDLGLNPPTYRPAAVTNLFYWNNIMHDITYGYGFDEMSGNFQVNNYGRGPTSGNLGNNDDVRAEAQDGSGTNNANFSTPVDGSRPRMQMFVWTHPLPNLVTINSPAVIAGDYQASGAVFGPTFATTGPKTGTVELVSDGTALPYQGCNALVGFTSGNIALVQRGGCTFVIKVKNAQNAGAIAVVVGNNAAGNPITMGGADATITIPSLMVSLADYELMAANLPANATLRANPLALINRDSDLDAGVITHEYGHGISNRLTGGRTTVSCLNNAEQMGEGWSDWFAVTLTVREGDTRSTPRGVGTYLVYQGRDGLGIRPTRYSTDMSVNPSTYAWVADTANISQPHGIGYVWNTMLWEMYWNLVDKYGFNPDMYGAWDTAGNNLAMQLVMDGMKMQVCRPGFVDGRDAILAADMALTGGANQCEIWRAFAKRGLGFSANQGSPTSRTDGVEAFDLPASCTTASFGGFEPPVSDWGLNSVNAGSTVPVKFTLTGAGDSWSIDTQVVDCTTLDPTGEAPMALASPGSTGLMVSGDHYHVNWQTDPSWAGTCRRVTLRIPASSDAVAYFQFF